MATKKSDMMKKNADMVSARKSNRKAFVAQKTAEKGITPAQARQRFFVQTRMSEMKAKGKTVAPEMRKQLQQKFQSGDVARKGFAAPKKKMSDSGSSSLVSKKVAPSYRQEDMGRGKLGGGAAGRGRGGADKVAPMRPGSGTGTGYKPNSPAGRGKGGEMMGSNKSSSAQAGKFAPKKKAPMNGSKY